MKILIDIGHPAHVHLFKHLAWDMQDKGHQIFFTCRDKEFEIYLLKKYGFSFQSFGRKYSTQFGKLWGLIEFDIKAFLAGLTFKPDILVSHGSIYAAHAAFLLRKPHISMEDTFNFEQINLYKPFTQAILTGDYQNPLTADKKAVIYSGYHELAYLHPNRFTPDGMVLEELGIKKGEKYVIMRFVSWIATHDQGHTGISMENKIYAVREFQKYARVFISSESTLPNDLIQYKIPIAAERMHDALAFASLILGESFTMLAEAAVLGVPSVLVHDTRCYYLEEQQMKFGLTFNYNESESDQVRAVEKGTELLQKPGIKSIWQQRRNKMLLEKIDVSAFMVWFVENFPESRQKMLNDPNFQYRFR